MAAMCTDGADLDHQIADPVHMHLLSLGVEDVMCKGEKPTSVSGMQYACVPGGQATRRCAAWPEPRWASLPDGIPMEARVGAMQQGDLPAQNRFSGIRESLKPPTALGLSLRPS
ncbi:TPA: hypothetical protein ACH3X2_009054 [Trebouxia sp. C0005]